MFKKLSLLFLISIVTSTVVYAGSNYQYEQQSADPYRVNSTPTTLKGRVVNVPSGVFVPAITTVPISSATAILGQAVTLTIGKDFYYNNNLIAPAGSMVYGTVTDVSKAKHGSMNGRLCVKFTQVTTPYGVQIPISGMIRTDDGTGVLRGGTKLDVTKEYAKDMVIGSATGALSGLVFGALAGGNIARGAALGTAVGAGGGVAKAVYDKGHDVEIPINSSIEIMLTQPITINPSSYNYNY